ncbi:unnamed protein product [Schistosoma turkestanicum]|nr:unnamed protein product [Schistosoma turkestanicum]
MPPSLVYMNPEELLLIPCYAKANPEPRYYWTLNGKRINWIKPYQPVKTTPTTTSQQVLSQSIDTSLSDEEKNQFALNDSYNLMMMNDESGLWYFDVQNKVPNNVIITGTYQCIAINAFGKALSMPMRLEIARIGTFHDLNAKTILIKPNETNILNCSTTNSIPTAKIQWMVKNDEDGFMNFVHEDENHMMDDNGKFLMHFLRYENIFHDIMLAVFPF